MDLFADACMLHIPLEATKNANQQKGKPRQYTSLKFNSRAVTSWNAEVTRTRTRSNLERDWAAPRSEALSAKSVFTRIPQNLGCVSINAAI